MLWKLVLVDGMSYHNFYIDTIKDFYSKDRVFIDCLIRYVNRPVYVIMICLSDLQLYTYNPGWHLGYNLYLKFLIAIEFRYCYHALCMHIIRTISNATF